MADNTEILKCPACGKPMTKIHIESAKCNIDVCLDGCGGIYFDNREFKKMDEIHEEIPELEEALKGKKFEPVDTSKVRICPNCSSTMIKNFASAKHEIEIDECYSCGAVFLDCNELFQIRAQYKTEKDRAAHFNDNFLREFESELVPNSQDAQKRIEHVEAVGQIVRKLFKIN